jgi:acyl carrier protein
MLKDKVRATMADVLGLPLDAVGIDASIENIEEWDSMAHLNIIMSLEKDFGISISANDAIAIISLSEICDYLVAQGHAPEG